LSNFNIMLTNLQKLEFSSKRNELYKVPNSKTYSYMGVYPYTELPSSSEIARAIEEFDTLPDASLHLHYYLYNTLREEVRIHHRKLWDKSRMYLDELPTKLSVKLYIFLLNVGIHRARDVVEVLQTILGNIPIDGCMGNITIDAINNTNTDELVAKFDECQLNYYKGSLDINKITYEVELPSNLGRKRDV